MNLANVSKEVKYRYLLSNQGGRMILKRGDCVGPSIMLPAVFFVVIVAKNMPGKATNILATSSLIVVPAAILTGLVTVYVNIGNPAELNVPDIVPGPMLVLLSISIVPFLVSITPPGKLSQLSLSFQLLPF
jgi:hypothetical protein